ncbi:hypothetical protein NBRC10512_004296 [Rhodotorula toruloides]|uniref:RHTO0S04e08680g1_1 n=2 Tax=Rhodotorula toruloides TaxID=5286 RepID=A0A061AQ42_RHOTO|nr:uncharacterized protein RHTO_02127 [Rhodotorula toruloides NP11]EMS21256.1 hypothetical protein RHTO_02127 [Rhodotorula toruloides NP11]CDR39752.1 RHTO0S04e08680g1_1 [Rhodotorula toruloides]
MPTASRKTSADAVVCQTSPLCRLPPDVLHAIFFQTITSQNFIICKQLLPNTLEALYCDVVIRKSQQLACFASSLKIRPANARSVRFLTLGKTIRYDFGQGSPIKWLSDDETHGSGQLPTSISKLEWDGRLSYRPASMVVGIGLLKDLLRILTNVRTLDVTSVPLLASLFAADYLESRPFSKLRSLWLQVDVNQQTREDWDGASLATLARNLRLIPSLGRVGLYYNVDALPVNFLNLEPSFAIAPRSWQIDYLAIRRFRRLGPETAVLFSSLAPTVKTVIIDTMLMHRRLFDDLACLPASISLLSLDLGCACSKEHPTSDWIFPALSSSIEHLVNLEHLHLTGNIVSVETYDAISGLSSLICVSFGAHTALSLPHLLKLIKRVPPSQPKLQNLYVMTCECPSPGPDKQRPNFPSGFGPAEVDTLIKETRKARVKLSGTIYCTTGNCTHKRGKVCPFPRNKSTS